MFINKKLIKNRNLIYILSFVLIVLGVVAFWYWREAVFSKEILKLEILGPDSAKLGDEFTYTIKYKNNGNFALEKPRLIFELPEYSLREDSKTRFMQELDDIYPGEERSMEFKGRLLGKEGDVKVAHAWLNYIPHNLSARYESETTLATKIDSVPITLTYDVTSKVEKGKEVSYSINYFSNVDYPLENLSIRIDRVDGFDVKSSDPISLDNSEWKLETLNKGQGGKIRIRGLVTSDIGIHLNLSAKLGMWQDGVFIVIKEVGQEIETTQPLIFISQQINGNVNYVASPGETLNYQIFLRNIGSTSFNNLFLIVRLEGNSYDLSTLQSQEGQVRQGDNLIVFDPKQVFRLQQLSPKEEVEIRFQIKIKDMLDISDSQIQNLSVKSRIDVLDISQEFITKISSQLDFRQRAYRKTTNSIENFGPVPPKVGEATSYAILWEVKNHLNELKNIRVKAVLPQNVSLVDTIYPESQASNFSFDSKSREIIWLAGNLSSSSSTSLTFQVVLTPTSFQAGSLASLIGQATVFAEDQFTNATIQKTVSGVNTILPDDRDNSGGGIVQ